MNYYSIYWPAQRNNVCEADLYMPHTRVLDAFNVVLSTYEQCAIPPLRRAGMARAYELVVLEDENTDYQTLGPVSKMFNLIVRAIVDGPESDAYKQHKIKRQDFMWMGSEGMMMCGTNGSQLWDVAFITQALVETGLAVEEENKGSLVKALEWLDEAQIRKDPKHYHTSYRHSTKGAWGFRYVVVLSTSPWQFEELLFFLARKNKDILSVIVPEKVSKQSCIFNPI
jgi:lanosterol synthase